MVHEFYALEICKIEWTRQYTEKCSDLIASNCTNHYKEITIEKVYFIYVDHYIRQKFFFIVVIRQSVEITEINQWLRFDECLKDTDIQTQKSCKIGPVLK